MSNQAAEQMIADLSPLRGETYMHLSEEAFYEQRCEAIQERIRLAIAFIESCCGTLAYCGRSSEQNAVLAALRDAME